MLKIDNKYHTTCDNKIYLNLCFHKVWMVSFFLLVLCLFDAQQAYSGLPSVAGLGPRMDIQPSQGKLTPDTQVLTFNSGKTTWVRVAFKSIESGQEFQFDQHLCALDPDGQVIVNSQVDAAKLAEADRAWTPGQSRLPKADDVVRFIDRNNHHLRHDRMGTLQAGDRFWFQGRLYAAMTDAKSPMGLAIRDTGIILKRVDKSFVRSVHTVIDLTVVDAQGKEAVIAATPEHPFYVPARHDYLPLGLLKTGMVLQSADGSPVTVKKTWPRHGQATVYNFEVQDAHNYYVVAADNGSEVLVHNGPCNGEWLPLRDAAKKVANDLLKAAKEELAGAGTRSGRGGDAFNRAAAQLREIARDKGLLGEFRAEILNKAEYFIMKAREINHPMR